MPTQKYPSANKLLDHVIAVNERHLKRLFSERVRYYHEDRTDHRLRKGTPELQNLLQSLGGARFLRIDWAGCIIALRSGCLIPTNFLPILIYM